MAAAVAREATLEAGEEDRFLEGYRSRPRQLARWLLQSRDALREKYRQLRAEEKRLKVRVSDVTKSRDHWRQQAEGSVQQLQEMQEQVQRLSASLEQALQDGQREKKVSPRAAR